MNLLAAGGLVEADLHAVRAAAQALAGQVRAGVVWPVALPRASLRPLTIVDSEPTGGAPVLMMVLPPSPGAHPVFATLNARERQVTALRARGLRSRQVAAVLVLPVG